MGVGSLHNPREYDGRLPPDVDYYLDLVIPRFEEPRKKIGSRVRLSTWKNITNKVINYMQLYSRLSVNLPAIPEYQHITSKFSKFTSKTDLERTP